MRHIDAFCHFFPPRLFEKMSRTAGGTRDIGKRMQGVPTIYDLDARLKTGIIFVANMFSPHVIFSSSTVARGTNAP